RLEDGLPIWTYRVGEYLIERALFLTHLHNTLHVSYRMLEGKRPLRLSLRPFMHFRMHDAHVSLPLVEPYRVLLQADRCEVSDGSGLPSLKLKVQGEATRFVYEHMRHERLHYGVEQDRGYDAQGDLWSHGHFKVLLDTQSDVALTASSEDWSTLLALPAPLALEYESTRRTRLIEQAGIDAQDSVAAELTIACDQFLINPVGRYADAARASAQGQQLRTVIAGYHWFTDWGRDTMISLEGLTLATRRFDEARWILLSFAHYVRDGLIPNMFPEGAQDGLYHTADATLWFFHAVERYHRYTRDDATVRQLQPVLERIVAHHLRGTHFGIGVDPADGLLAQGAEGYQLTWMDAKCGDWVVTPRRGKAVEINALWYNALCVVAKGAKDAGRSAEAGRFEALAAQVRDSFNRHFWYEQGGYLYDVIAPS
ncbi:MAG TPA: amylo-alpha-1,6-glucosidase, partial [Polyangiales bacterium]|nr:amylo-alpha-1,6-glucosidase [Polyangiales bacterium]